MIYENPIKSVLIQDYSGESIIDIEDDVCNAINEADFITKDEYGFHNGTFHIEITWEDNYK